MSSTDSSPRPEITFGRRLHKSTPCRRRYGRATWRSWSGACRTSHAGSRPPSLAPRSWRGLRSYASSRARRKRRSCRLQVSSATARGGCKSMAQITEDVRSISRLFGDALDTLVKLIQTEIRLAKAEVGQKARQAATGMGMLFGAMLLVIPALVLLLIALAVWLAQLGVPPAAAYALSGVLA